MGPQATLAKAVTGTWKQRRTKSGTLSPPNWTLTETLHSSMGTHKTARKWVSHEFLALQIESGLYTAK